MKVVKLKLSYKQLQARASEVNSKHIRTEIQEVCYKDCVKTTQGCISIYILAQKGILYLKYTLRQAIDNAS